MRQFAPLLLVPVAVALVTIGYDQYSMTAVVSGDTWRPYGSLGLALMVTGLVIGYWAGLSLARPSWGRRLVTRLRTAFSRPGRFILAGLFLGGFGLGLLSITDSIDGEGVYHPFDILGLEIAFIGLGLLGIGARRLFSRSQASRAGDSG